MIPIGMGLAYAGYVLGLWGYCLIRGYNVPFTAMFGQTWPGGGADAGGSLGSALGAVGGAREGGGSPVTPNAPGGAREGGGSPVLGG